MTSFAAALRRLDCLCLVVCICTVLSPFLSPIVAKIQFNPAGACMSAMGHCKSLQLCHVMVSLCMQVHNVDALVSYRADDD